ncbi:MAG: hypothetical protein ACI3YE_01780, partial [Candidatus Avispirillum sp.]
MSIADLQLPTERENSRLLITAGADGFAVRVAIEKAKKKVYFLLRFFSLAAYAAPLRGVALLSYQGKSFLEFQEPFSQKR